MAHDAFDPAVHHRHSLRLAGYSYSSPGNYFVTVVTEQRLLLFGDVVADAVQLSLAGEMVLHWLERLPAKFPTLALAAYALMPNHLHAVIILTCGEDPVGAVPCDRPGPTGHKDLPGSQPANANNPPGQGQARGPAPTEPILPPNPPGHYALVQNHDYQRLFLWGRQ